MLGEPQAHRLGETARHILALGPGAGPLARIVERQHGEAERSRPPHRCRPRRPRAPPTRSLARPGWLQPDAQCAQLGDHLRSPLVAQLGLLGEGSQHDLVEIPGHARPHQARRRGGLVDRGVERRLGAFGDERRPAGEHLVEHDPKAVDIRPPVAFAAERHFRGDVVKRPDRGPAGREAARPRGHGETEVEHHHPTTGRQHDVSPRDVAMDDVVRVGMGQGLARADRDPHRLPQRQRPARNPIAQVGPRDMLHRDEEPALDIAHVVDAHDPGVIEPGHRARLAQEALAGAASVRQRFGEQLERHDPVPGGVPRLPHRAHAALAEPGEDLVGAK